MKTIYSKLDQQLKIVKKQIRDEFAKLSLAGFDELNVIGTKKRTEKIYSKLKAVNSAAYIKSATGAYKVTEDILIPMGFEKVKAKTDINDKWLLGILGAYHLATGYLYNSEADRKRMRLNEEILTAREYTDHAAYRNAVKRAMDLWWTQSQQHGIYAADEGCIDAFRDYGVERVRWVAEMDGKECKVCHERNGKVYDIDKVPEKTHYGCRCTLEPILRKDDANDT
jgi:SPP1 gp7 family putative phage head morphogenesis protein